MSIWVRIGIALALAAAAALLVAGIVKGYEHWRTAVFTEGDTAGAARVKAQWDEDRAKAQAQAAEDARLAARETQRRLERQSENDRAQQIELARARADADRARIAADVLQLRASAYLDAAGCGTASGDSAIACIRAAAAKVADALGQCGAIARAVAADADDARARGQLCERNYDSLTLKSSTP